MDGGGALNDGRCSINSKGVIFQIDLQIDFRACYEVTLVGM